MKKVYCYVIIVLLAFIGCVNKDELAGGDLINGNHTLKAQIEQSANTRTMVDEENRVCWVKGDQIGVFDGDGVVNIPFSFSGMADSGQSAIFKGNLPEGGAPSVAYYPYDDEAVLEGDKLSFVLPSEYDYTENSNAPMIGVKQDDGNFLFKHLCGLLKFSIVDIPDDAKQVIITSKGENAPNISGTCIVEDVIEDGVVLSIPEGSSQVTIKLNGEVGTQTFYVPVPVGVYSELQVLLEKEDGTYFFSEKLSNVTIRRATIFHVTKDLAEADKLLDEFVQTSVDMSSDEFLSGLEQLLKNNEAVSGYELNINGCEITYKDGSIQLLSFVYTGDPFGISTEPAPVEEEPTYDWIADATELDGFTLVSSTETRASSEDDIFHNTNILRWAPFQNKLGIGWDYQTLLEKSPLKLNVIGDYVNQEATSSRLMDNLSQAGIIDIESHGSGGKYIVIPVDLIDRGIHKTVDCKTIYFGRNKGDTLTVDNFTKDVGIPKGAFERYSYVENGILFNNSCESAQNSDQSLKSVFTDKGISTYTGYTNIVNTYNVQEKMNWYTNSLLCDLKSNIESIPDNLSYDGEKLETKEEEGKVIRIFVPETGYFDVTTRKEMRFVEFGPQGTVETTETEIYLPFQFKGAENLKDVCKFGILISNQKEIEERITGSNIGNYAVGKSFPISEMLGKTSSRFKTSKEDLINTLNKMGIGSSGTKYYWIYLEYKGRYYISNEYGSFSLNENKLRAFLIELYDNTGGDNWFHNDNWCSAKPVETWFGITKSDDMYSIDLQNNNLQDVFYAEGSFIDVKLKFENINLSGNNLLAIDIHDFENLLSFNCSNNPKLMELNAQYLNNILTIDVSNCPKLEFFGMEDCDNLQILKANNCTSLKGPTIYEYWWHPENLTYVDFSNCTSLTGYLKSYEGNEWKSFDFGLLDFLEYANFENCSSMTGDLDFALSKNLAYVNVSGCSALKSLDCYSCSLKKLYVSECLALENLDCSSNVLTSLELSGCISLKELDCSDNSLTNLNISGSLAFEEIDCSSNFLINLDVSNCPDLLNLDCSYNNSLISIKASNCSSLEKINFNQYPKETLMRLDLSGCSALKTLPRFDNMETLIYLNLSDCLSVERIICYKSALKELYVSGCSALKSLSCYENALTSLNLSGCSALLSLDCYSNSLNSLNVSSCFALQELNCSDNSLTYLDVDKCSELRELRCSSNSLTSLDLSGCSELRELSCRNNKISSEIPSYLWGVDFYLDYRYDYYYEDGETKYIDNNIGWWYPGEPESGKHEWPD